MVKYKIAVIGSRSFTDKERMFRILDKNIDKIDCIISGGARSKENPELASADKFAEDWCKKTGVPIKIYYAVWYDENGKYDKGAGMKRNHLIIRECDIALIWFSGNSRGTANSIEHCKYYNKPHKIFYFKEEEKENENNLPKFKAYNL